MHIWRKLLVLMLPIVCSICSPVHAQALHPQLSINEQTGLPQLTSGGGNMMKADFSFWGANWSWAGSYTKLSGDNKQGYQLILKNKDLDFDINAAIKSSANSVTWQSTLATHKNVAYGIGGMVFNFNLAAFGAQMGSPELLPDNSGWRWGKTPETTIEMRFQPALPKVYFEMGNKNQLRAFFLAGSIEPKQQQYTLTLTYGKGITLQPGMNERFGATDTASWPVDTVAGGVLPIDLSFLDDMDKPAGRRGRITVKGDHLVYPDGKEARFWGTNITSYALFNTPKDAVVQQAKRLAALGYNLVRIHHEDSYWVTPNIFGNSKFKKNTLTLDPEQLDKLDWWIKCLKDQGIYVWLDMHVQRVLYPDDHIDAFDEMSKGTGKVDPKGFNYVNASIQQAMKKFNEQYLDHVNAYTKVANKDEPAILAILLTNENDLTNHYGNLLLPSKSLPQMSKLYMDDANAFAQKTGLPASKVWHSWEPGPAKIFLNDLEHRFDVSMIDDLRRIGVKAPIVTTSSWGFNPLFSLPALTTGDIIDVHSYGGYDQMEKNPLVAADLTDWMGAAHVVGKPLSVTEWNASPFPLPDRQDLPLFVAARAAHQDWDAMMHFAYTQEAIKGAGTPSNWHSHNDPSLLPTLAAAALMYRRGDVREATSTYVLDLGQQLFNQSITPDNSPAIRTAIEKGKLLIAMPETKELPWLKRAPNPAGATILTDPSKPVLPVNAESATSDTGQLHHDWNKGIYTINTPRTQAAMGWVGGQDVKLSDVEFHFSNKNVAAAVQSLNNLPIDESRNLLVTLAARSVPNQGKAPFLIEPIAGEIKIKAPQGLKAYRKGPFRQETDLQAKYEGGAYTITLDGKHAVNWIVLH